MLQAAAKTRKALNALLIAALVSLLALTVALALNTAAPSPALALGAVTPLDGWPAAPQMTATAGNLSGTFTVSDGIDRLLVIVVSDYDSSGTTGQTFSATYGGKNLTQACLQNSSMRQTWIGYLKESDIAGRADDNVAVMVTGTHTQVRGYIASYAGVDQAAPINAANGVYTWFSNNQPIGGPLAVKAGGYAIYAWSGQSGRTRTSDTEAYAENSDVSNGGFGTFNYGIASKPLATNGTTNPSVTWSQNNNVSVSFVTLNPDTAYPAPTTSSISPTSKEVGEPSFTVTVNGTNFLNSLSVVRLDGADRTTTFVSTTQLTATIPASDLAAMGTKSITVFTPAPGGGTSNAQTLTVGKATPLITWDNPADIVYGTALSTTQLSATASVPGTFVYTPALGVVLSAGSAQMLHVDFAPSDSVDYNNASKDVTINVNKANLIITANNGNKTYGESVTSAETGFMTDGLVNGDSVTGLTLTCDGSGTRATVVGSPYSIVPSAAVGTGLANYNITYVKGSLAVKQKTLTITANDMTRTYGDNATLNASAFTVVGLVNGDAVTGVSLSSGGAAADATVAGGPYPIVPSAAVGTGLTNYAITYVNGSLTLMPAGACVTLTSSVGKATEGRTITFTATVTGMGATGTIRFQDGETLLGVATLSDGAATWGTKRLSVGSHSVVAVYDGDNNFASTTSPPVDLTVIQAGGFRWVLIGWIIAALLLGLFLFLMIYRRRRQRRPGTISRAMEIVFNDAPATCLPLSTVEEASTYPIQLERELESSVKKVQMSMEGAVQAISRTVETKDPYVTLHQKRVSEFACTIAKEMGLTPEQIDGIRVAGLLHDIGKVTVPTEILSKPGKLSKLEMAMIREHPRVAFDILKNVEFDRPIAKMALQHHERMDGSGYPDGIKGDDILREARILAVADVVEAMCTDRPYRPALGVDEALAELDRGDGTRYDPEVVRACKNVLSERGFALEGSGKPG